jgi:2,4-dienoyl-CoA reductase (NADPH2)
LIVTGGFSPNPEGCVADHAAQLRSPDEVDATESSPRRCMTSGGKIALQILHTGRYGFHKRLVSASALQAPINIFKPKAHSPKMRF